MQKLFLFFCLFTFSIANFSQIRNGDTGVFDNRLNDSTTVKEAITVKLNGKTKYTDYKIFSHKRDTTFIDTTLTIKKDYKFNFIRKDDFELLAFHNQGQTFNNLAYTFNSVSLYPNIGARAKHFSHFEVNDVYYYNVATPSTELAWRTGLEQGQVLDALITFNTSKRKNFAIAYKGLRSLGKYRNALSSHGNMRLSYHYITKNKRYSIRFHQTAQQIYNNENGGLTPESVTFFETNNSDFKDRARLVTHFTDAVNLLKSNRTYLDHNYAFWIKTDSLQKVTSSFKIGHTLNYETKKYDYDQKNANTFFGESFNEDINDTKKLTKLNNELFVSLQSPIILGKLQASINNYQYNYRHRNVIYINDQTIAQSLNGNVTAFTANWKTYYKNIKIQAKAATTLIGNLNANYFLAKATYKKDSLFTATATLLNNSKSPNFNFLLNQSDYVAYNWQNNFNNELTRSFLIDFTSKKWLNASLQYTNIDNYTYFKEDLTTNQTTANQFNNTLNYIKVKASKILKYKKFSLANTFMFQQVVNGETVFNVPTFTTRNSLYYTNYLFKKKPLYLQTGITFKYFTKYYANSYNPLLAEFSVQNTTKIGNYPVFDLFINAKVRQTRLFLKAEHLNSLFSKNNYYAAPNYPYRDFVLRFGLVWNFFI